MRGKVSYGANALLTEVFSPDRTRSGSCYMGLALKKKKKKKKKKKQPDALETELLSTVHRTHKVVRPPSRR
ncbi:MAG: hypothetical protein M1816_000880 [Peltula sp. TS41687]|nr:MAG: hypothetical protein M1816_000880 [Peltula sp. TS41687]